MNNESLLRNKSSASNCSYSSYNSTISLNIIPFREYFSLYLFTHQEHDVPVKKKKERSGKTSGTFWNCPGLHTAENVWWMRFKPFSLCNRTLSERTWTIDSGQCKNYFVNFNTHSLRLTEQTLNINPIGKPIPNKRGRKPLSIMPSTVRVPIFRFKKKFS